MLKFVKLRVKHVGPEFKSQLESELMRLGAVGLTRKEACLDADFPSEEAAARCWRQLRGPFLDKYQVTLSPLLEKFDSELVHSYYVKDIAEGGIEIQVEQIYSLYQKLGGLYSVKLKSDEAKGSRKAVLKFYGRPVESAFEPRQIKNLGSNFSLSLTAIQTMEIYCIRGLFPKEDHSKGKQELLSRLFALSPLPLKEVQVVFEDSEPFVYFQSNDKIVYDALSEKMRKDAPEASVCRVTVKHNRLARSESFDTIFAKGFRNEVTDKDILRCLRESGFCYPQSVLLYTTHSKVRCADIFFTNELQGKQFIMRYLKYQPFCALFGDKPMANIKVDKSTLMKTKKDKRPAPKGPAPSLPLPMPNMPMSLYGLPGFAGMGLIPMQIPMKMSAPGLAPRLSEDQG